MKSNTLFIVTSIILMFLSVSCEKDKKINDRLLKSKNLYQNEEINDANVLFKKYYLKRML